MRYDDIKLLLKVIPEAKLNSVASRSSFVLSVCDIARQRHSCSTCCLPLAGLFFFQGNYCSTSTKLNRYLSSPLPQALQHCISPAPLLTLKFQFARRGRVSPTQLSLGLCLPPISFQATYKDELIQHIPSEPGDRLLSATIWFGT